MKFKKIILITFLALTVFSLSACDAIQQAIDDTFSSQVPKFKQEEEEKEEGFEERIKKLLWDESNKRISYHEILEDAQDRMGFKFSSGFGHDLLDYINEHDIERYLSEEEVIHILELSETNNLLLNRNLRHEALDKLYDRLGEEVYVFDAWTMIGDDNWRIWVVDPNNSELVDVYRYHIDDGDWEVEPYKFNSADNAPMDFAIRLKDMPFDSIDKIMETAMDMLEEAGEKRPYDNTNMEVGVASITGRILRKNEGFRFYTSLRTSRDDISLDFDQNGELIEKD